MAKKLLEKKTVVYTGAAITRFVNEKHLENYASVQEVIAGLGIGVVGEVVTYAIAKEVAGIISIGFALVDVINKITESIDPNSLGNVIKNIKDGDKLEVVTSLYEWTSGSGNSSTLLAESTYRLI